MKKNEDITIQKLIKKTVELRELFSKIEEKPWNIEAFMIELLAETGTLADSVMIKEGYRKTRSEGEEIDLEDDISDILFLLIMIAEHYNIDIASSYIQMIDSTHKKLNKKIQDKTS